MKELESGGIIADWGSDVSEVSGTRETRNQREEAQGNCCLKYRCLRKGITYSSCKDCRVRRGFQGVREWGNASVNRDA